MDEMQMSQGQIDRRQIVKKQISNEVLRSKLIEVE